MQMPAATHDAFKSLESTGLADWIRDDAFSFPIMEGIHVLAVMFVVGSIGLLDLRLLGIASRNRAVTKLTFEALPWAWVGFVLAVISGTVLFFSQAAEYMNNLQFQLKMLFLLAAGLNMAIFHFVTWRRVAEWDTARITPVAARVAGGLSLVLWTSVVVFGRWIGWTLFG